MKLLFIITGLNPNVRTKVRDDFHGLTYLVETLDLIMRDQRKQNYLPDKHIDLLCEILKVLFNITVRNETSVATEEEEEIQFRRLAVVLHDLLLCKSYNKEKQSELCSNTVNLLTNVPTACFSELILLIHGDDDVSHIKVFERHDMTAIDVLLAFLKGRLDNVQVSEGTALFLLNWKIGKHFFTNFAEIVGSTRAVITHSNGASQMCPEQQC